MVSRELGVAVVPRLLLDEPEPELAAIPLDHLVPDRVITLTTRGNRPRTPAVVLAAELVRAERADI